jgi:hypothetical protein
VEIDKHKGNLALDTDSETEEVGDGRESDPSFMTGYPQIVGIIVIDKNFGVFILGKRSGVGSIEGTRESKTRYDVSRSEFGKIRRLLCGCSIL